MPTFTGPYPCLSCCSSFGTGLLNYRPFWQSFNLSRGNRLLRQSGRNVARQLGRRVLGSLSLGLLRNLILQVRLGFRILYSRPALVHLVLRDGGRHLGRVLWILGRCDFRRMDRERVAFEMRTLTSFYLCGVIITIDMDLGHFFAASFLELFIDPLWIRPAVVNVDVFLIGLINIDVADVGNVRRLFEYVDVTTAIHHARSALGEIVSSEIDYVDERVRFRT